MTSKQWKKLIKKQLSSLGNKETAYNSVISTLVPRAGKKPVTKERWD